MPDPPQPCLVMHCEAPGSGIDDGEGDGTDGKDDDGGVVFPKRLAHLRGGYIFLCKPTIGQDDYGDGDGADKRGKIACIPLAGCTVEFPPGGRRVFREHAHTGARAGYAMAIHVKSLEVEKQQKTTCFIVLDSLSHREAWAAAIRMRCDVGNKVTVLRPGGMAGSRMMSVARDGYDQGYYNEKGHLATTYGSGVGNRQSKKPKHWGLRKSQQIDGGAGAGGGSGNADLDAALEQFGQPGFLEEKWVHQFLQQHAVNELPGECDKLEKWMDVIKNGLRGAVLEQYEYFVEASREMSTMGREVAWLRNLVERQQETLMSMKNIDFGAGLEDVEEGVGYEDGYGYLSDEDEMMGDVGIDGDDSDASSVASSSSEEGTSTKTPMRNNIRNRRRESRKGTQGDILVSPIDEDSPARPSVVGSSAYIEIPPWISDVTEEVEALVKESRYTDATDLILKAKAEVSDILAAHEQPTPPVVTAQTSLSSRNPIVATTTLSTPGGSPQKKLHKKQQALLHRTSLQIDALMDRMSKRLAENLRRKNEALKASAKRERADPLSTLAPLASPVCLNDDAVALQLLVKLGRHQEAATAYAARRSLVLSECLHERPISSPVGMDAVIYAAQLSSSFFSSLAMAVEGFLDLFDAPDCGKGGADDDTSLNSRSLFMGGGGKRIPSGALSAVVLWCDSELAKFTNVFGSSRLLGSLSLSPPGLRRTEDKAEGKNSLAKEREHSIEVASKCIDQAFLFASENLDSIGLPLTPKLAENMRPRLKGCESEVASLLDARWKSLAYDWVVESNVQKRTSSSRPIAIDDRRV